MTKQYGRGLTKPRPRHSATNCLIAPPALYYWWSDAVDALGVATAPSPSFWFGCFRRVRASARPTRTVSPGTRLRHAHVTPTASTPRTKGLDCPSSWLRELRSPPEITCQVKMSHDKNKTLTCSWAVHFLPGSGSLPSNFILTLLHTLRAYAFLCCTLLSTRCLSLVIMQLCLLKRGL